MSGGVIGYAVVVRRLLLAASLITLATACPTKGEEASGDAGEACDDLAQVQADILIPNCTGEFCHDADSPAAGLDFSASPEAIATQLIGIPSAVCGGELRVVPGDRDASMLVQKLIDPTCGERMPIDGELADSEVECIASWVDTVESTCETCGGSVCIDLTADANHCGECDNPCPDGVQCVTGECACPAGTELCDGGCVDTQTDPLHCGECGMACELGEVCSAGECVATCGEGLEQCGESCVDTETDPNHCGGCDMPCGEGLLCVDSECTCGDSKVTFSVVVEPLLVDNCALGGCHAPPQIQIGLDLRAGFAYDSLVGVASSQCGDRSLVEPGDPGESYLLDKLRGVDLCDGDAMPLNATSLSKSEITAISTWICQGAANE